MSSWLDSMAAKAGIIEEEEEEEESQEIGNEIKENEKNEEICEKEETEKEPIKQEEEKEDQKGNRTDEYFTGKTTKQGINFVRSVQKLQQMQEKAYDSSLEKVDGSLDKAADLENSFKLAPKIAEVSNDSKENYGHLRNHILSLRGFTKTVP